LFGEGVLKLVGDGLDVVEAVQVAGKLVSARVVLGADQGCHDIDARALPQESQQKAKLGRGRQTDVGDLRNNGVSI
jgi:hypothetical protein